MLTPGSEHVCRGCSFIADHVDAARQHFEQADLSFAAVSSVPLERIEEVKARMGWTLPFVSSHGTSFADDCGAGDGFALSVFLRDGDEVYRTYSTQARGVDRLMFVHNVLDLCPYGRQQDWEDSPAGWPQYPTYG